MVFSEKILGGELLNNMRIISGKFKGSKIDYLKTKITRPLKDSVKENIFNVLFHSNHINIEIKNANILDMYSGVGSFGLECISRGAKKVVFIEQDYKALRILRENLEKLKILDKAKIIKKIDDLNVKNEKFDIFFFDPPFKDKQYLVNLENIKKSKVFNKNHVVIIHREKKMDEKLNLYLNIFFIREYGRSKIIFGNFH